MCNISDPNLVTFYLCIYPILNEEQFTFHLQYKLNILVRLLTVNIIYSSNSIENATPL